MALSRRRATMPPSIRATMNGTLLHTAFDVLAWLAAGLALLWLTRVAKIRFPASPAGDCPISRRSCSAPASAPFCSARANLWLSHQPGIARSIEGASRGRHRGGRALQAQRRHPHPHRRALRAAVRGRRRGRPHRLLSRGPRRLHLRHADRRCRGATISATASRAIRCSSTRAPRWRRSRSFYVLARACATTAS